MEDGYGYSGKLDSIVEEYHFRGTYLDNAAAPLVAKSVALKSAEYIASNQLVNPHSRSYWSEKTLEMINNTRSRVLKMLGAPEEEFDLVFTANSTAALKLIGECMSTFNFLYLTDSHTSVVGLRKLAKSFETCNDIGTKSLDESWIVSWPLQSNFDGTRYPKEWLKHTRDHKSISVLDLSAYCATSMPSLDLWPDLAVLSFYKIFGLPDLGGLLIRKQERIHRLLRSRKYAGGGTVSSLAPQSDYMIRSDNICTSLEDGTLPFHSIGMLKCAITEFEHLFGSFDAISAHTKALRDYCHAQLSSTGLCKLISPQDGGPIVTFTLLNAGYYEFSNVCSKLDIHVRTGTLCNVGAFTLKSGMTDEQLIYNHKVLGKTCSDEQDNLNGQETGVIRVSFGPYNTKQDVDILVDCIKTYFAPVEQTKTSLKSARVKELIVYPIKSCGGLKLDKSTVLPGGLKWDREFCLVNPTNNKVFSLKNNLIMAKIYPKPEDDHLRVTYLDSSIEIPLNPVMWPKTETTDVVVCGPRVSDLNINTDPTVVEFFSSILKQPCTLAKMIDEEARHSNNISPKPDVPLSLSNSSPILLISTTSAKALDDADYHVFRANIIVETETAWDEDSWSQVRINSGTYNLLGPCRRCNMVCVTKDGGSDARPYLSLTKSRRFNGKIWFGQHMQTHGLAQGFHYNLQIGDVIQCLSTKCVTF